MRSNIERNCKPRVCFNSKALKFPTFTTRPHRLAYRTSVSTQVTYRLFWIPPNHRIGYEFRAQTVSSSLFSRFYDRILTDLIWELNVRPCCYRFLFDLLIYKVSTATTNNAVPPRAFKSCINHPREDCEVSIEKKTGFVVFWTKVNGLLWHKWANATDIFSQDIFRSRGFYTFSVGKALYGEQSFSFFD